MQEEDYYHLLLLKYHYNFKFTKFKYYKKIYSFITMICFNLLIYISIRIKFIWQKTNVPLIRIELMTIALSELRSTSELKKQLIFSKIVFIFIALKYF